MLEQQRSFLRPKQVQVKDRSSARSRARPGVAAMRPRLDAHALGQERWSIAATSEEQSQGAGSGSGAGRVCLEPGHRG
jgi:hypothetical protein